jgi:hypothetical protein
MRRWEGGRSGQEKLVSKGGAEREHKNWMPCSVSARVPGAGGTGQQIGVVSAWVVVAAGHEKTENAQKLRRQGSVGYPAVAIALCVLSSTAAPVVCQPKWSVGQRSRRHLERIYQVPPVPPPASSGAGGEARGTARPRALREPCEAAGCSMHWGKAVDCSEQQTES